MRNFKRILSFVITFALVFGLFPPVDLHLGHEHDSNLGFDMVQDAHAAGSLTTSVTGLIASWTDASNSSGKATWTASGNTITGNATGYKYLSFINRTVTTELTLTNDLGSEAELAFSYTLSGGGFVSGISGNSYEGTLANGASLTIKLTSPSGSSTNTLTITGITLTSTATGTVTNTFKLAENGSYTVDGNTITGDTKIEKGAADTYAVVATPASGYKLFGWYNETTGKYLSTAASTALTLPQESTVYPVFIPENSALFGVGSEQFFDLTAAANAASAGSNKTIILLNNGTLPAGDYTIPSGVTLLIPYNDANTINRAEPEKVAERVAPSAYRTLTMASGASITINGELCVSGKQSAKQDYAGCVTGPYGCINMQSGSSITMENGSKLYAWGYIIGSGSVEAKSGATVYEDFQLLDFRGGDGTTQMQDNEYGVFPMSQYYIQNIEVPLKLHAGALEYGYMSIEVTLVGNVGSHVPVISTTDGGAMFELTSGYIIKDYDESTGRLIFTIDDNATIAVKPITISMRVSILGSVTIKSQNYNLPIPGHMTVNAVSGNVTLGQNLALLPGAELNVGEDVFCTVGEGIRIIVYDADDWGNYCNDKNERYYDLPYVASASGHKYPAKNATYKDATVRVDGIIDASAGYVYTTAGGANIYSTGTGKVITVPGSEEVTHQVTQNSSVITGYPEIAITPAKLKNGDGSYFATPTSASEDGKPYGFEYDTETGKWICVGTVNTTTCVGHVYDNTCDAECNICGATRPITHTYDSDCDTVCNVCGATRTETADHTYDNACDTACNVCGETRTITHTPEDDDGDCTTAVTCSVCGAVVVEAKTHEWGTSATDGKHTCTNDGCTKTTKCADAADDGDHLCDYDCGAENLTDHIYGEGVITDPTCTEKGYTTHTCSECGDSYVDTYVDATGHSYGEGVVTAPTCTATGYTTHTCTICSHSYTDSEVAALGHSYDDGVVTTEPTCTTEGVKTYTCGTCGGTKTEAIAALGHTEVIDAAKAPTCTETGLTEGKHCSVCGEVLVAQEVVDALGHSYTGNVKDNGDGTHSYQCVNGCNAYGEAIEHRFEDEEGNPTLKCVCDLGRTVEVKIDDLAHIGAFDIVAGELTAICGTEYRVTVRLKDCADFKDGLAIKAITISVANIVDGGSQTYYESPDEGAREYELVINGEDITGDIIITLNLNFNHADGEDKDHNCDSCGAENISDHAFSAEWTSDENGHWHECACGAKRQEATHVDTEDQNHFCDICGYEMSQCADGDDDDHNCDHCGKENITEHDFSGEWMKDSANHWKECACGVISEKDVHKYDDDFDAECDTCGYANPNVKTLIAMIGEQKFDSLEAAVAAAKDGDVIVLYSDVTLTEKLVVETEQTWDFGEYTVKFANGDENYSLVVRGDLTIESGKFVVNGWYGIGVNATGTLTVNGGEFAYEGYNDYLIGSWGTTTINSGKFVGDYCNVNCFAGKLDITGGEFKVMGTDPDWPASDVFAEENGVATITGGTFSTDVTEYCADGYHTVDTDQDGVFTYGAHDYEEVVTDPTCTEEGYTTYTCACGDTYVADKKPATDHQWTETYEWKQVEGEWTCTATRTCANSETCTETATATITSAVKTPATCEGVGTTTYTATFGAEWAETQTKDVDDIPATDHKAGTSVIENETEPSYTAAGSYDKVTYCSVCGDELSRVQHTIPKLNIAVDNNGVDVEVDGKVVIVNSQWACRVAYWDAETQRYVTLSGTMIDKDSYSFAAPDGVTELVVVVIGDMDKDGDLDATDNQKLAAALLAGDNLEDDLMMLVMDVNGNGKINSADRTLIARALLESTHDAYKPFAWETISQSEVA